MSRVSSAELGALLLAFAVPASAQIVEKVSGSLAYSGGTVGGDVAGYRISPDGAWAVYYADGAVDETYELFSVPLAGGAPRRVTRRSFPSAFEAPIIGYAIDPSSSRVLYVTDQDLSGKLELYSAPIDGSSTPI